MAASARARPPLLRPRSKFCCFSPMGWFDRQLSCSSWNSPTPCASGDTQTAGHMTRHLNGTADAGFQSGELRVPRCDLIGTDSELLGKPSQCAIVAAYVD